MIWGAARGMLAFMGYAILRVQKLKSAVAVHRSMKHAFRAQETPNADKSRTPDNTHIGAHSVAEGMAAFREALPEKVRKNAVQCVEYLMTASPEAMQGKTREQQDAYFQDSLNWLRKRHGAENVIYAGIHRDEKTPHMYAYVVPKDPDTGRLNCRRFLGGAVALREMQTDFAEQVGKQHGLQRGIEGSKAKHQRVSQFYAQIEKAGQVPTIEPGELQPKVLEKRLLGLQRVEEAPEAVAERLNAKIAAATRPLAEKAAVAVSERRRAVEMTKTAQSVQERLKTAEKVAAAFTKGLDKVEVEQVMLKANVLRYEKAQKAEKQRRVAALPDLLKKAVGAAKVFATKALAAIQQAGGRWQDVRWSSVEDDTKKEAIQEQGLTHYSTAKAILMHSPGQADKSPEMVKSFLAKIDQQHPNERSQAQREEQDLAKAMRGRDRGYSR